MIIGTKTDLFLYMELLLSSTCPMIHSSIIIVYIYIYDIVQYSVAS